MKKILALFVSISIISTMAFGMTMSATATEDLTPNFNDDFNSYTSGTWIENDAKFTKNWFNELIDYNLGDTNSAPDSECREVAKIIDDPTPNAVAGNKVVHIKNDHTTGSFFYVAPRALRVKDFEVTFKVYNLSNKGPWYGLATRKENNVRYNGTNNVLLTLKTEVDTTQTPARENLVYVPYRGYGGAGAPQEKTKSLDNYDSVNEVNNALITNYDAGTHLPNLNTMNTWYTVKTTVKTNANGVGSTYKIELIMADGTTKVLGTLPYKSKSTDIYGFLSFNACISNMYLDDFNLINLDTEPAPEDEFVKVTGVTLNKDKLDLEVGKEETLVATINPSDASNNEVKYSSSDETIATVTDAGKVVAVKEGKATITATTSDGGHLATCEVNVTKKKEEVKPEPKPEKKGCGKSNSASNNVAGSLLLCLTACGFVMKRFMK